jgi:hypothetical protein
LSNARGETREKFGVVNSKYGIFVQKIPKIPQKFQKFQKIPKIPKNSISIPLKSLDECQIKYGISGIS